ncbi:ROK family protein [Sphingobacterium hungaricum]|uniref:ROK family protein n=1 Tax=Sphingobacterium hungaricum TaxID=2082723 RepID=A0A928UXT8_9SPHI|nr:ROK family protein [Sphingobacterium hungaricum]MBE8713436.1 ROK family protein [Sphingobacterium hungaricum]
MKKLEASIVKSLYFSSPQSTADLSKSLSKSVPNVTNVIYRLLEEEMIMENGLAPSTGGRRAAQFLLKKEKLPLLICLAIDQHFTQICVFDFRNNFIIPPRTIKNDLSEGKLAYERIVKIITEVNNKLGQAAYLIGITIPGFVNHTNGINDSYATTNPLYNLRQNIQNHFQVHTFIENDSTAIAIAEHKFGRALNSKHALVINLNWGVGLGMIINNQLFRGHSGYAGEFSHIPLSEQNDLCSCGKRGCIEVEASLLSAIKFIKRQLENGVQSSIKKNMQTGEIEFQDIISSIQSGDQLGIEATKKIAHILGKGIATLIHIMNPEKIVISGRGAQIGELLIPSLQSSVLEFSIPRLLQHTKIQISNIQNPQLLGTACVIIEQASWNNFQATVTAREFI